MRLTLLPFGGNARHGGCRGGRLPTFLLKSFHSCRKAVQRCWDNNPDSEPCAGFAPPHVGPLCSKMGQHFLRALRIPLDPLYHPGRLGLSSCSEDLSKGTGVRLLRWARRAKAGQARVQKGPGEPYYGMEPPEGMEHLKGILLVLRD